MPRNQSPLRGDAAATAVWKCAQLALSLPALLVEKGLKSRKIRQTANFNQLKHERTIGRQGQEIVLEGVVSNEAVG